MFRPGRAPVKETVATVARAMPLLADVALEHTGQPEILEVHNIIKR